MCKHLVAEGAGEENSPNPTDLNLALWIRPPRHISSAVSALISDMYNESQIPAFFLKKVLDLQSMSPYLLRKFVCIAN